MHLLCPGAAWCSTPPIHCARSKRALRQWGGSYAGAGSGALPANFLRPYQGYADIYLYEFAGTANYNSLQASFSHRLKRGISFGAAYTFSKVLDESDVLATVHGTSSLLLLDTDLMGAVGTVEINPGVHQTAYGVFSDLVDIAKAL